MKRSLTGIRASGEVHLGNYLGTIVPALERQKSFECLYFIADMHSLTTNKIGAKLLEYSLDVTATWMACGLDPKQTLLYRQSDLPYVAELAWYLSCCTGLGLLEKGHAYKDASASGKEVNHGVLAYPVLMAADIIAYDADIVPVGKDQKQHVEMARDMAGSFNAIFGEGLLKLPEPAIEEDVMVIPGLDGRKMSKSYGNGIPLFASEGELRKKVLSIKTDSSSLEASKILEGSLVGQLFKLFASADEYKELGARLQRGGMGWGHAKEELAQVINRRVQGPREIYQQLRPDENLLLKTLADGAERAFAIAYPIMERVRKAVGFSPTRLLPQKSR